jgi:predicted small secreted protein
MKKIASMLPIALLAICALVLTGCSNTMMGNSADEIPSDLINTAWTRHIGTSTALLEFGTDGVTVSGTGSRYDGYCRFGSYSNGCWCWGNNNGTALDFQYTCIGNTLTIRKCNNPSFNGQWTRL